MIVDVPVFLLTLLLLLFPRRWLRLGAGFFQRRRRGGGRTGEPWRDRTPGDPHIGARELLRFRNYIDLLRAGVGSWLLLGGFGVHACLGIAPDASRLVTREVIALRALVLLVGLLLQTLRFEHARLSFYPPVFYLAGLTFGLCGPWASLFAFILVWTVNTALPNAQGFLTVHALAIAVFGFLLDGGLTLSVGYAPILCFLPVLLSLLSKRSLVVFSRRGTHGATG